MGRRPSECRSPLVWSENNVDGKIDGWHVERGTSQDFMTGALEDDGYVPFFETHFYKSGITPYLAIRSGNDLAHPRTEFTTWWGIDEKHGPILISIQTQVILLCSLPR